MAWYYQAEMASTEAEDENELQGKSCRKTKDHQIQTVIRAVSFHSQRVCKDYT